MDLVKDEEEESPQASISISPQTLEDRIRTIVALNIFDPERAPESPANQNNRNTQAR